jgi:putative redox protein
MTVRMSARYIGNKQVEITHESSGAKIITAAPKDNAGDGSSFSPTDLAASSLGACMMTVMAIFAERQDIDLTGMRCEIEKHMVTDPRRIGKIPVVMHLPSSLSVVNREKLERVAHTCPVHHSLISEIDKSVIFLYDIG